METQALDLAAREKAKAHTGRPRSASADEAILSAVGSLLGEVGYRALCMEAVAARAGVSKATLYRRHKDKEALITAMIRATSGTPPTELELPPGSTRDSLAFLLRAAAVPIASPSWLSVLGAMFSEGPRKGGLASMMRTEILGPSSELIAQVVKSGVARGELRASVTTDVVNDVLFGALLARSMMGREVNDAWIEEVVSSVWGGVSAGPKPCGDAPADAAPRNRAPNC